jgi:DNA-binding NarL/FixJ family response regulator
MKPRVVLADDHVVVAEGLGVLLAEETELLATAHDGATLLAALVRWQPDIVVTDLAMPGLSGLDVLRLAQAQGLQARFLFLTAHAEPQLGVEILRAGAAGYLLKHSAGEELLRAVRVIASGGTYVSPRQARQVLDAMMTVDGPARPSLSSRQIEVMQLIVEGRRMKEIAADLGLSVRTVEDHKAQLMRTLEVKSTAELVRAAIRHGFVKV